MSSVGTERVGLTIEVLGQLVVKRDGIRHDLPRSRKTRGLLAYLAFSGRPHRRDDLCALLWEGATDPRGELRWSLAKIKAAIGASLEVSPDGVGLSTDGLFVDVTAFLSLAQGPLTQQNVTEALALWRAAPLADLDVEGQPAFQAWVAAEREALGLIRIKLLKAGVELAWAEPEAALSAARRLVAQEPWSEWGHARVIQLLERCGRMTEAASYMATTRRNLSSELGIAEEKILLSLPAAPASSTEARAYRQRQRPKPVVRIERFKVVSAGASAQGVAVQVTSMLNAALWRRACCEVVEGETATPTQMGEAADPDFAIRGAVVRDANAAHLSLRLINLRRGTMIWSCQDELWNPTSASLSAWVHGSLEAMASAFRSGRHEADDPNDIRNRLLEATALASALEPGANQRAIQLLNTVLKEAADDSSALALASWCYAQRAVYNWSSQPDNERREARYYAAAATQDGIDDPRVLTTIATARTLVKEGNAAQVLLERALRLNIRSPHAHTRRGWLANYADEPEVGARHFLRAIKLAPLDPLVFNAYAGLGAAHFIQGDYVQAIRRMEQALALNPKALWIQRNLVPAYAAVGDRRNAEEGVEALTKGYPRLTVSDIVGAVVFSPPVLAKIALGLRESGLPA